MALTPYYRDSQTVVWAADCLDVMRSLPADSLHSIVCDPPYEIGFMERGWDNAGVAFDPQTWREALRVARPGAYLLAFGAPRSYHRLACAIEDAGWEIRDSLVWLFGSGFPKGINVQQAINKAANGHPQGGPDPTSPNHGKFKSGISDEHPTGRGFGAGAGAFMDEAGKGRKDDDGPWKGWNTALKPAYEPIVLARKPFKTTVVANVTRYGTGAINVDATRIGIDPDDAKAMERVNTPGSARFVLQNRVGTIYGAMGAQAPLDTTQGRWPANVILDEEAAAMLDAGPSRFFFVAPIDEAEEPLTRWKYQAKASRAEREAGLEDWEPRMRTDGRTKDIENPRLRTSPRKNDHPTVKPIALMRWLIRLVTPPGGVVFDPFMGSGSTRLAALTEGFRFIGCDIDPEYVRMALARTGGVIAVTLGGTA